MGRKRQWNVFLAFVVMAALVGACCSTSVEKQIIGKWEPASEKGDTLEFFSDGTLIVSDGGEQAVGTYTFLDETRIKIELSGFYALGGAAIRTVSITDDTLYMTVEDGSTSSYHRQGTGSVGVVATTAEQPAPEVGKSSSVGSTSPVANSCNDVAGLSTCTEYASEAMELLGVGFYKGICDLTGSWSSSACPTASVVGSCDDNAGKVTKYYSSGKIKYTASTARSTCDQLNGTFK
jgi:hypothetical protein